MPGKAVVIALGGNAILRHRETGTAEEQFANVRRASRRIAEIASDGYAVVITHGNGPQVGDILLKKRDRKGVSSTDATRRLRGGEPGDDRLPAPAVDA
jgi:Carbamate kinase